MTNDRAPSVVETAPGSRRKLLMSAAALGFAACGATYGVYWFHFARYEVTTDDAYVSGNVVQVSPQITGTVVAVHADDTDFVQAGQALVDIDQADTRLALDQATSQLAQTVREVRALYSNDGALAATVSLQETNLDRLRDDLARRQRLTGTGAGSAEDLKHARDDVRQASAQLSSARKQLEANRALVDNTTVTGHPRVKLAAARLREAYLAWRRTVVPAPVSGQIARRAVQVGQRIAAGTPLMAVVPLEQVWVDANFKEGQLTHMRIGQPAVLTADIYGDSIPFHGRIVGLSAGTGSAFSLLPAQNATGNWIKVVQRIPVRIALDPEELKAHPLRVGLSMDVEVAVRDQSGPQLSSGRRKETVAETSVFADMDKDADHLIDSVITGSLGADSHSGHVAN
ncbi:MAG: HlyD family efflux transporter periplasmic adaptor subunit [Telmatospirillum sp.]|nr:HlyD family efflux transporter periplasmic adaptor subunit [Telmatospirillum sp.]